MGKQTWAETLITSEGDGTALTNSTTPTSILPTGAVFTLPANFFDIGKQIEVELWGRLSTVVTTPGNLTLALYLAGASFCASQAMPLNATAQTNDTFYAKILATCRAIGNGTTANAMFTGEMVSAALATSPTLIPATAPAVSSGFNSATSNALDVFATFSIANASNSLTLHQYSLRALN